MLRCVTAPRLNYAWTCVYSIESKCLSRRKRSRTVLKILGWIQVWSWIKILGWIQDPCFNRTSYLSWGRTELSCIQKSCSHTFTAHMAPPRMIVPGVVWTFQSRWDRSESWVHAHWFARTETPSPYRFPNIGLIKHNNPQLALTFFSSFSGPWQQLGTRPLERVWSAHLLTYWESVASWQFVSTKQNKLQLVDKLLDFIC